MFSPQSNQINYCSVESISMRNLKWRSTHPNMLSSNQSHPLPCISVRCNVLPTAWTLGTYQQRTPASEVEAHSYRRWSGIHPELSKHTAIKRKAIVPFDSGRILHFVIRLRCACPFRFWGWLRATVSNIRRLAQKRGGGGGFQCNNFFPISSPCSSAQPWLQFRNSGFACK